jgi:NAD(P)-dependent dehydrogenase (short-subunit alcohol dehydrogenase family)
MRDFAGKTAFVTGAGSGIGFALARAFLAEGMNVMLADVAERDLAAAAAQLDRPNACFETVVCDVADADQVGNAAARAVERFGKVHVLCNNAGVSRAGTVERVALSDWDWVIGVNLKGAVSGIHALLPHIKAHGEGGHILNTASINGVVGTALAGPYVATKFAIVGLTEVLAAELAGSKIGVSVLCPGPVRTRMVDNGRNRPARFGGPFDLAADTANAERNARYLAMIAKGMPPEQVAEIVLAGIRRDQLYIFTHADRRLEVDARLNRVRDGFEGAT